LPSVRSAWPSGTELQIAVQKIVVYASILQLSIQAWAAAVAQT
jgi:hypothetical protein